MMTQNNHSRFLYGFFLGSALSAAGALVITPFFLKEIKDRFRGGVLNEKKTKKETKKVSSLTPEDTSEKKIVHKRKRKPAALQKKGSKKSKGASSKDASDEKSIKDKVV